MNQENDYSLLARTNPVFLTAQTAVRLMAEAGIADATEIVGALKKENTASAPVLNDPDMVLGNAIVVEAKYRTMCRLFEMSGLKTNVDLPCGYTPKALHLTEKGFRFIGLDLPIVADEMKQIIPVMSKHPDRIAFHGVDATNYESLEAALRDETGPLCITTEGMMMYFTENEASVVVSNIQKLLASYGGCWITPDPEFILQFFLTFRAVLGDDAVKKLMDSKNTATSQSDVSGLTNSLIVNPVQAGTSSETAEAFLRKYGLKPEKISLAEYMPELSVYGKLSRNQIGAFKEAMRQCHYWKVTLSDEAQAFQKTFSLKKNTFGLDYTLNQASFMARLQGRVDTITAPEILKAWEAEKEVRPIDTVRIDCSALDYISSAGLRVMLMMHKESKNGVTLTGINDVVREILEQTGFDQLLHLE